MDSLNLILRESEVNKILQKTLKTYLSINKKNPAVASKILRVGGLLAKASLLSLGIKSHKVFCSCGRQLKNGREIQYFNDFGECLDCSLNAPEELKSAYYAECWVI